MGFTDFVSENIGFAEAVVFSANPKSRALFRWGGTFVALVLLILNRTGPHRSSMQTNLLVFFLFTSFPNFLFNIVRGSFGYWISFFAVLAHLFCPEDFPVSRFILFVITPDWIAKGLRGSSAGCIFCLAIGVFLVLTKLQIMTADAMEGYLAGTEDPWPTHWSAVRQVEENLRHEVVHYRCLLLVSCFAVNLIACTFSFGIGSTSLVVALGGGPLKVTTSPFIWPYVTVEDSKARLKHH